MRIIQIVTNLNLHDAIGNEVLAMDEALSGNGYDSLIMAITIHPELVHRAVPVDLNAIAPDDLVLFHKATGDMLTKTISCLPCKRVMIYHNITPAKFFAFYDPLMAAILWQGRRQLRRYARAMTACWADSAFNAQELRGCSHVEVLPILFTDHPQEPDPQTLQALQNIPATKLLCIGRVAPNKKLEDAIKLYVTYARFYDPDAILFIAGSWEGMEKYYAKLKGFCADLNLSDRQVVFLGSVSESVKEAYLRGSDALLCLSEHEGFCVPLIEAANRDLPVVAYAAAAVPETLGASPRLYGRKDYMQIARGLYVFRQDEQFRQQVIAHQRDHARSFHRSIVEKQFLDLVSGMIQPPAEETNDG